MLEVSNEWKKIGMIGVTHYCLVNLHELFNSCEVYRIQHGVLTWDNVRSNIINSGVFLIVGRGDLLESFPPPMKSSINNE